MPLWCALCPPCCPVLHPGPTSAAQSGHPPQCLYCFSTCRLEVFGRRTENEGVTLWRRAEARSAPHLSAPVPAVAPWVSAMPPCPGWQGHSPELGVLRSGGEAVPNTHQPWHSRFSRPGLLFSHVPTPSHRVLLPPGVSVPNLFGETLHASSDSFKNSAGFSAKAVLLRCLRVWLGLFSAGMPSGVCHPLQSHQDAVNMQA